MKHTAGVDQQTSPVWEHDACLWAKKMKGNSPTTFTLFLGHKRQMHCTIWEVFQASILLLLLFFKVHDTQQEAESFKLLWHQMCFRRGAGDVDECRTDQVLHTFVFKVWQHQSCAWLGLMTNIHKSLWDSAVGWKGKIYPQILRDLEACCHGLKQEMW